jgi:uncharacterized protein YerC
MELIYEKYGSQPFWQKVIDQVHDDLTTDEEMKEFFEDRDIVRIKSMHHSLLYIALQQEGGHFPVSVSRVHKCLQITNRAFDKYLFIYEKALKLNKIQDSDIEIITNVIGSYRQDLVNE